MTLKEWRLKKKWTQERLAIELMTTEGNVSRIENRKSEPGLSLADRITTLTSGCVGIEDLVLEKEGGK